jgi:hypothetical protein
MLFVKKRDDIAIENCTPLVDKMWVVLRFSTELSQTQKWNDRTWDVIKWVGGISAGLAISAAIALVGIVLRDALAR